MLAETASQPEVMVMLSGGIDSSACLDFYIDFGRPPCALFVDYGQPAAEREQAAASAVAAHYRVDLRCIAISPPARCPTGFIVGRNALLFSLGLFHLAPGASVIAMGLHGGTTYPDCTVNFIRRMQDVFALSSIAPVQAAAPFAEWTRADVLEYSVANDVPLGLTYSCEAGGTHV